MQRGNPPSGQCGAGHGFRANRIFAPRKIVIGRTAGCGLRPTNPKRLISESFNRKDRFCKRSFLLSALLPPPCRIRPRTMRKSAADNLDATDATDAACDLPGFAQLRRLRTVDTVGESGCFGPKNTKTMPEIPHGVSGIANRSDDRYLLSSATDFCAAATLSPAVTFLSAAMACGFISLAL